MDKDAAWLQNPLLENRFAHVTARDVVKRIKKYYPFVKRGSTRGADIDCLYMYITHRCLGEGNKGRYTVEEIMLHCDLTNKYDWQRKLKRHFKRCEESVIYLERFLLIVKDLQKIETAKQKKIHEQINLLPESK